MRRAPTWIPALGVVLACAPIQAQSPSWRGVEFGVGTSPWLGRNGELFEPGVRGLVALWAEAGERRFAGVELIYGRLGARSGGPATTEGAVNVAVRQMLGGTAGTHPYAAVRAGFHRLSGTEARAGTVQFGATAGPEVGTGIPVTRSVRLLLAAEATWGWYADTRTGETTFDGSGGYAFRWGVRAAVAVSHALKASNRIFRP